MADPQKVEQDDADLEEGEIESDDGDEVIIVPTTKPVVEETISKRQQRQPPPSPTPAQKSGALKRPHSRATTKETTPPPATPAPIEPTSRKEKKALKRAAASDPSRSNEDDWMGSVEMSIAMALKKKGIDPPPMPKLEPKEPATVEAPATGKNRNKKQRRRDQERKELKKKIKAAEAIADGLQAGGPVRHHHDVDDLDEYEMMCIRGGSPPPLNGSPMQTSGGTRLAQQLQHDEQYFSGDSYSSYDSYEERRRRRSKERRGTVAGNQRKGGRDGGNKRRRLNKDDSEDDRPPDPPRQTGPRKLELCKFYLMECCAKREKCLYMHSDFPCKYYYLGMKNHNQDNCKFSHGKPLTDQLRNILLKHLETAPKEILGDFPRINRENAVNMINKQHLILLREHGIEPTASNTSTLKIPTIQDLISKHTSAKKQQQLQQQQQIKNQQPDSDYSESVGSLLKGSSDKPRRTRWCDTAATTQPAPLTGKAKTSKLASTSFLSLKNLNGVLSNEQIEKLTAIGIETLDQINQMTVAQLNQFGLSIAQIHEIQLNSINIQKLGLAAESTTVETIAPTPADTLKSPFYGEFGIGGKDFDMRLQPTEAKSGNKDIDMRLLPTADVINAAEAFKPPQHIPDIASPDQQFAQQPNVINYDNYMQKKPQTEPSKLLDYSQYLKESNLAFSKPTAAAATTNAKDEDSRKPNRRVPSPTCGNRDSDDIDDDDETNNQLVIEEEPTLEIDESWYSDDEDDVKLIPAEKPEPLNPLVTAPMPAIYDPSALYPTAIMNKIDLSSSVMQFISNSNSSSDTETKPPTDEVPSKPIAEPIVAPPPIAAEIGSVFMLNKETPQYVPPRDPRKATDDPEPDDKKQPFEFFTRHVPETSAPTPSALDESIRTPIATTTPSETSSDEDSVPIPTVSRKRSVKASATRTSIYEYESSDSNGETDPIGPNTKDKDMRLSSLFVDKANSKGDIDFRLPFKPVNYMPAKEIQASIGLHDPIPYVVSEVEVAKPDYSDIRRNISTMEEILDPRLRRILRLGNASSASEQSEDETATRVSADRYEPVAPTPAEPAAPRLDPRRRHLTEPHPPHTLPPLGNVAVTPKVDVQLVLRDSNWYKDLNSKHKLLVNQQLAIVSKELNLFHSNPAPDKRLDLTFVMQNVFLQQLLSNLGVYISDAGLLEQLPQMLGATGFQQHQQQQQQQQQQQPPPHQQQDFHRPIEPMDSMEMDFNRPPPNVPPFQMPNSLQFRPGLLGAAPPTTNPFAICPQPQFDSGKDDFGDQFGAANSGQFDRFAGDANGSGYFNGAERMRGKAVDGGNSSGGRNFRGGRNTNDRWNGPRHSGPIGRARRNNYDSYDTGRRRDK